MCKPGGVPDHVEYRRFATQGRKIEGIIPLASLPRVVSAVCDLPAKDAVARLQLELAEDSQRRVHATGRISARVVLQCQRCTQLFEETIETAIAAVIVSDDESAADVPRADEPIMADGDRLDVRGLVEEELLLALPMVARCDNPQCRARYETDATVAETRSPQRKDNPFAVLKQLKHDDETD